MITELFLELTRSSPKQHGKLEHGIQVLNAFNKTPSMNMVQISTDMIIASMQNGKSYKQFHTWQKNKHVMTETDLGRHVFKLVALTKIHIMAWDNNQQ